MVISNDSTLKQPVESETQEGQGKEIVLVEEPDEMDEESRLLEEPPGWLPDGWIMEVCHDDNGSIYQVYALLPICPFLLTNMFYHFVFKW